MTRITPRSAKPVAAIGCTWGVIKRKIQKADRGVSGFKDDADYTPLRQTRCVHWMHLGRAQGPRSYLLAFRLSLLYL